MPKLKTKRGAAKRFRRTAKGYKHRASLRNHILTKKSQKRKRQLRGDTVLSKWESVMIRDALRPGA